MTSKHLVVASRTQRTRRNSSTITKRSHRTEQPLEHRLLHVWMFNVTSWPQHKTLTSVSPISHTLNPLEPQERSRTHMAAPNPPREFLSILSLKCSPNTQGRSQIRPKERPSLYSPPKPPRHGIVVDFNTPPNMVHVLGVGDSLWCLHLAKNMALIPPPNMLHVLGVGDSLWCLH